MFYSYSIFHLIQQFWFFFNIPAFFRIVAAHTDNLFIFLNLIEASANINAELDFPMSGKQNIKMVAEKNNSSSVLQYLYEIDHMVCPKCGSEMKVIAVIRNPPEIRKILKHLRKIGRPPPGVDYSNIAV